MKEEQSLEIKWESENQKKKSCESKCSIRPGAIVTGGCNARV